MTDNPATASTATYTHFVLLALRGVVPPSTVADAVDLGPLSESVNARIVASCDPALEVLHYKGALGVMLGTGGAIEDDPRFRDRLASAMRSVSESIEKQADGGALLLVQKGGTLGQLNPAIVTANATFSISLDDIPEDANIKLASKELSAVVGALSMSHSRLIGVRSVGEALVAKRGDGLPLHWLQPLMGRPRVFVASPFPTIAAGQIQKRYAALVDDRSLERATRLLRTSFQEDGDRLRAFLAGWNALEVFLGKVFSQYRAQARLQLRADSIGRWPAVRPRVVWLVRRLLRATGLAGLLKEEYPIADRFALVASILAPNEATDDLKLFRAIAKQRNRLSHGEEVEEDLLPIAAVRGLVQKYLSLFVDSRAPTT